MTGEKFQKRLKRCSQLMESADLEALLLTKPSNMFYLTGDGRLCAYALVTREGKVALGAPQTDIEDVKQLAFFDHLNYVRAQQATITKAKAWVDMVELEETMHRIFKEAGHGSHIFGPPIHGIGINFEESPLPPGHAFFHGEKAPPPLPTNVVIAVGNCGLYTGPWGVRVEDTVAVGADGPLGLTDFPYSLTI